MAAREILLTLLGDSFEGTVPADGRMVAVPSRPRLNGEELVLPNALSRDIAAGEFVEPTFLEVTPTVDPKWYWKLRFMDDEDTVQLRICVLVPDGVTPIALGDLPVVNPDPGEVVYVPQPGSPGAPGESAYEVAVDNGFVGTEAEWLASLEGPEGPSGTKVYASPAELDAVTTNEVGFMTVPAGVDYFGDGAAQFYETVAWIVSNLSDAAYSTGIPPAGNGTLTQQLQWSQGYGAITTYTRTRDYDTDTGWDAAWRPWVSIPIPSSRPSADGLWRAGPDPFDDTFVPTIGMSSDKQLDLSYSSSIAQQWQIMSSSPGDSHLEDGYLQIKSASATFEGVFDAGVVDVGTRAFVGRSATRMARSGRLEWTAAAAAANAVAGMHVPLRVRLGQVGFVLHATFAMTGGITETTRLACGVARTAAINTAMGDNEPGNMSNWSGAGYGAADEFVTAWGRASLTTILSSEVPVDLTGDQLVDLRLMSNGINNSLWAILTVRTGSNRVVVSDGFPVGIPLNDDMSFFLRASAGGTVAQPKVSLYRLRVGLGQGVGRF